MKKESKHRAVHVNAKNIFTKYWKHFLLCQGGTFKFDELIQDSFLKIRREKNNAITPYEKGEINFEK